MSSQRQRYKIELDKRLISLQLLFAPIEILNTRWRNICSDAFSKTMRQVTLIAIVSQVTLKESKCMEIRTRSLNTASDTMRVRTRRDKRCLSRPLIKSDFYMVFIRICTFHQMMFSPTLLVSYLAHGFKGINSIVLTKFQEIMITIQPWKKPSGKWNQQPSNIQFHFNSFMTISWL